MTYKEFLEYAPCWMYSEESRAAMDEIAARHGDWTVEQVLELYPKDVPSTSDILWIMAFMLTEEQHKAAIEVACKILRDAGYTQYTDPGRSTCLSPFGYMCRYIYRINIYIGLPFSETFKKVILGGIQQCSQTT